MPDSDDDLVKRGGGGNGHVGNRVAFDYIKGQHFRVIHADGAIGSVTPNGHIHAAFFSERQAIPRRLVHELNPNGTIGAQLPTEIVSRGSIIREMDVDVIMTLDAAKLVYEWFRQRIEEAEKQTEAATPGSTQ